MFHHGVVGMGGRGYHRIHHSHAYNYVDVPAGPVHEARNTREQEKKELRDLNVRLAEYIEKTRFLEAQNRQLASELVEVKAAWGKETSAVKVRLMEELRVARDVNEERNKEKSRLEVRMKTLQDQLDDARKVRAQERETSNKLNVQISELEAELRMLRRTNDSRKRDKENLTRLNEELEKLRMELSNETIQRLDVEHRAQTLAEHIEFITSVHEQELQELTVRVYRDTTAENREFWKNELSEVIEDIQSEYDSKIDTIRSEMKTFYKLEVEEFRAVETSKHKTEMTHLRLETTKVRNDAKSRMTDLEARNTLLEKQYQDSLRELDRKDEEHTSVIDQLKEKVHNKTAYTESLKVELQTLTDVKLSLEVEITAYRKLLETGENRSGQRRREHYWGPDLHGRGLGGNL